MDLSVDLNDKKIKQKPRPYLGLSQCGHSCTRFLQYYHYWAFEDEISARVERLFNVGHEAEKVMIADLAKVGIFVTDDQKQIIGIAGHWRGHIDGLIDDGKTLIEFKTHNERSFNDLKKKGVKVSKPTHYAQMNAYMEGLGLTSALYMAMNKNTSEYYFEEVLIDPDEIRRIRDVQNEVLIATDLLDKIGTGRPSWFECKFCSASDVCHQGAEVPKSCRTCKHVDVHDEGKWRCSLHDQNLIVVQQIEGCGEYEKSEMLRA